MKRVALSLLILISDLPVPAITYLLASLKMGLISALELVGQKNMPSLEQLAVALSEDDTDSSLRSE